MLQVKGPAPPFVPPSGVEPLLDTLPVVAPELAPLVVEAPEPDEVDPLMGVVFPLAAGTTPLVAATTPLALPAEGLVPLEVLPDAAPPLPEAVPICPLVLGSEEHPVATNNEISNPVREGIRIEEPPGRARSTNGTNLYTAQRARSKVLKTIAPLEITMRLWFLSVLAQELVPAAEGFACLLKRIVDSNLGKLRACRRSSPLARAALLRGERLLGRPVVLTNGNQARREIEQHELERLLLRG